MKTFSLLFTRDPGEDGYSCNAKPTRGEKASDEKCYGDESRDEDWAKDNKQRTRGVATVKAMTVPTRVRLERTRRDPPAVTAVAALAICLVLE